MDLWVALLLGFPFFALAQGGPPMVTDDPGTPGDRHWEINVANLLASTHSQDIYEVPYLDVNYGWGDHVQLKIEGGYVTLHDSSPTNSSGLSSMLFGVKVRFLDEDTAGVDVSTYPQVSVGHFFSRSDPELTLTGNSYFLPIELSKHFGDWVINPEIGYLYGSQVSDELNYGVVVAYEKLRPLEPLAEVHFSTRLEGGDSTTLLNLGFRYSLSPNFNFIAALGHTITQVRGEQPEWDSYVGMQILL